MSITCTVEKKENALIIHSAMETWKYVIIRNFIILSLYHFSNILHPPWLRASYATELYTSTSHFQRKEISYIVKTTLYILSNKPQCEINWFQLLPSRKVFHSAITFLKCFWAWNEVTVVCRSQVKGKS